MPTELRPDQIEDLAVHIANPKWLNHSEPGTGKTPIVNVLMEYAWEYEKKRSFFVQPKGLIRKNYKELLKFTDLTPDDIAVYDGTPPQREKIRKANYKVLLLGFDMFGKEWPLIKEIHPDFKSVVVDEIHMGFKGNDSNRTKGMYACMRTCDRFLPMSGTLIDGRLDSAYPVIRTIEPRYYYDHNAFMCQHALTDDYGQVMGWTNHEKVGRILARHQTRRLFSDIHGIQDPIFQVELCEMHHKQRYAYDELEEKALLELEDRFIDAQTPALQSLRCRQVMQHPHTFGLLKDTELTGKEQSLMVHIEDHVNTKKPVVIFGVLVPEQHRIVRLLTEAGLRVGLINGEVPEFKRGEIDEAFQEGRLDAIVGSPECASVGYNWGHCDHFIYSSIDYRDTNFSQSYKRGIRGKRTIPLRCTILKYDDCEVENRIFSVVERKSADANRVDSSYRIIKLNR